MGSAYARNFAYTAKSLGGKVVDTSTTSRLHGSASCCNGHQGLHEKQAFLDNR